MSNASPEDLQQYAQQTVGLINTLAGAIDPGKLDTRAYEAILPALTNAQFVSMLEEQADPVAFKRFADGTAAYLDTAIDSINQSITEIAKQPLKPEDMSWQASAAVGLTTTANKLITVSVGPNGYPTFTLRNPKSLRLNPEELQLIERQLNRNFAPKLRDIIKYQSLVEGGNPQEIGIRLINDRFGIKETPAE